MGRLFVKTFNELTIPGTLACHFQELYNLVFIDVAECPNLDVPHRFAAAFKKSQLFFSQAVDGKTEVDLIFHRPDIKTAAGKYGYAPFHLFFCIREGLQDYLP